MVNMINNTIMMIIPQMITVTFKFTKIIIYFYIIFMSKALFCTKKIMLHTSKEII